MDFYQIIQVTFGRGDDQLYRLCWRPLFSEMLPLVRLDSSSLGAQEEVSIFMERRLTVTIISIILEIWNFILL